MAYGVQRKYTYSTIKPWLLNCISSLHISNYIKGGKRKIPIKTINIMYNTPTFRYNNYQLTGYRVLVDSRRKLSVEYLYGIALEYNCWKLLIRPNFKREGIEKLLFKEPNPLLRCHKNKSHHCELSPILLLAGSVAPMFLTPK